MLECVETGWERIGVACVCAHVDFVWLDVVSRASARRTRGGLALFSHSRSRCHVHDVLRRLFSFWVWPCSRWCVVRVLGASVAWKVVAHRLLSGPRLSGRIGFLPFPPRGGSSPREMGRHEGACGRSERVTRDEMSECTREARSAGERYKASRSICTVFPGQGPRNEKQNKALTQARY